MYACIGIYEHGGKMKLSYKSSLLTYDGYILFSVKQIFT